MENYGADGIDNDNSGVMDGQDPYEQNFYRIEIEGTFTNTTRRLELILSRSAGGAFWNAIFAGNSSGDPSYTMNFGGTGTSADLVQGDIYIGGKISVGGAAALKNEDGSAVSNQVMY